MLASHMIQGILAKVHGSPGAEGDSYDSEGEFKAKLDMHIKEVARSVKEMDTAAIEDALHRLVDCILEEDRAEDEEQDKEPDEG